jgi:hypothetical protein
MRDLVYSPTADISLQFMKNTLCPVLNALGSGPELRLLGIRPHSELLRGHQRLFNKSHLSRCGFIHPGGQPGTSLKGGGNGSWIILLAPGFSFGFLLLPRVGGDEIQALYESRTTRAISIAGSMYVT